MKLRFSQENLREMVLFSGNKILSQISWHCPNDYFPHMGNDVVVVLLFPANNTALERYNIIQNKLLEATREAIRLTGLVALIMAHKVNKCMWPTGVRGQGSDRGVHHGATRTCRFRGVGSVLVIIKQVSRDWLCLHDRLLRHSLIFFQVILS